MFRIPGIPKEATVVLVTGAIALAPVADIFAVPDDSEASFTDASQELGKILLSTGPAGLTVSTHIAGTSS